jgi:hypothetical protein
MPMYMDIHEIRGATAEDVAKAHSADVKTQDTYGVEYHKYWFNESCGKIFCLCSAPSPEAAASVHREAHGPVAEKIIEVAPEIAEGFLGGCEVNPAGAALVVHWKGPCLPGPGRSFTQGLRSPDQSARRPPALRRGARTALKRQIGAIPYVKLATSTMQD